jgi:hypothetical protein
MMTQLRNKLYKILTGDTKTNQVSGPALDIVFDRDLSLQLYDKLDLDKEFFIEKDGKKYKIKQLN